MASDPDARTLLSLSVGAVILQSLPAMGGGTTMMGGSGYGSAGGMWVGCM